MDVERESPWSHCIPKWNDPPGHGFLGYHDRGSPKMGVTQSSDTVDDPRTTEALWNVLYLELHESMAIVKGWGRGISYVSHAQ